MKKIFSIMFIIITLYLTAMLAIWTIILCQDNFNEFGFNIGVIIGIIEFWIVGTLLYFPNLLKCSNCRTKLKLTQQFCTGCGEKINKFKTLKNNFQKKHIILILTGILISVGAYYTMISIFNSNTTKTATQESSQNKNLKNPNEYGMEALVQYKITHSDMDFADVLIQLKNTKFSKDKMLETYRKSADYCNEYCQEYGEEPSAYRMCQADFFEKENLRKEFIAVWNFAYYTGDLYDIDDNILNAINNHDSLIQKFKYIGNVPTSLKENYKECENYCTKATANARGVGEYNACFEERLKNKSESDYKIYTEIYDLCSEITDNECDKNNCIKDIILK